MSEVSDLVMPLLQKIHNDIGFIKTDIHELKSRVTRIEEKFETQEHWTIQAMGLSTMAKAEASLALSELKNMSRKLDVNDN